MMKLNLYSTALISLTQSVGKSDFYEKLKDVMVTLIEFDELLILQFNRSTNAKLYYRFGIDGNKNNLCGEESWRYLTRLYVLDPFYRAFVDKARFGFFSLEDVAPDEFSISYSSYFNFLNVADEVGYLFSQGSDSCFHIDITRFGDNKKFSAAEKQQLLQLFEPLRALCNSHLNVFDDTGEASHSNVENVLINFGRDILTKKEYQVCQLLLQGYATKAIASIMEIGYETVKMHKKNIYGKTYLSSQSELLALFIDILQQDSLAEDVDHLLLSVQE